jgi:hypothetical protein
MKSAISRAMASSLLALGANAQVNRFELSDWSVT